MGHVYTPGLKVKRLDHVKKERRLPIEGEVLVSEDESVEPDTPVARTYLPGPAQSVNVSSKIGIEPESIKEYMLKEEGEEFAEGEVYAETNGLFGLFKTKLRAPFAGSVYSVSEVTGQVILREKPTPLDVKGYMRGKVTEIEEDFGVSVETDATFIQGIFGIGGETFGEVVVGVDDRKEVLTEDKISVNYKGKIIVGGGLVTADALSKAIDIGAEGVVSGGFNDKDLRDFLGYDIGVAITGSESIETTLVVTEGFGEIPMAPHTFELLNECEGKEASINGATQIRAGVIRPEVIVPRTPEEIKEIKRDITEEEAEETKGVNLDSKVRSIRMPYFGRIGKVVELPSELQELESESEARVLKVEFDDGETAIVPRANVEIIEE